MAGVGDPEAPPPIVIDPRAPRQLVQVLLEGDAVGCRTVFQSFTPEQSLISRDFFSLSGPLGHPYDSQSRRRTQAWDISGERYMVSLLNRYAGPYRGDMTQVILNPDDDVYLHLINMSHPQAVAHINAAKMNVVKAMDTPCVVAVYADPPLPRESWPAVPLEMATYFWTRNCTYLELPAVGPLSPGSIRELLEDTVSVQIKRKLALHEQRLREQDRRQRQQTKTKATRSTMARFYTAFFGFLFDMFQLAIATMDVITDIWVAVQYYQCKQYTFFWIGVVDICIAQMCYSAFFVFLYVNYMRSWKDRIITFLCILPFGQLVPLLIYIESHKFTVVSNVFKKFNWHEDGPREQDPNEDPLSAYLKAKFLSHMGFYLESLVEAIPQSILQMVAIVVTGQVNAINVVSIAISIFSVAAKGLMMSYSINRPTFIFSFLCVLYDVFSVFTTVSWLFYRPPDDPWPQVGVFYFNGTMNVFTAIWFWKQGIFVIICAFAGLNGYIFTFLEKTDLQCRCCSRNIIAPGRRCTIRTDRIFSQFLMFWGGCFIFLPVMIVMEGTKFAPLPLAVFRSFDSPHARQMPFYGPFFDFMMSGNWKDKLYSANLVTSLHQMRDNGYWDTERRREGLVDDGRDPLMDMVYYNILTPYEKYSLQGVRDAAGLSYRKFQFERARKKERRAENRRQRELEQARNPNYRQGRNRCGDKMDLYENAIVIFGVVIVIPTWVLSNLYSLIYPFLCLFSLDWNKPAALQRAFTIFLLVVLFLMLVLSKWVIRFRKSVSYTQFYYSYRTHINWLPLFYDQFANIQLLKQARRNPNAPFPTGVKRLPISVVSGPYDTALGMRQMQAQFSHAVSFMWDMPNVPYGTFFDNPDADRFPEGRRQRAIQAGRLRGIQARQAAGNYYDDPYHDDNYYEHQPGQDYHFYDPYDLWYDQMDGRTPDTPLLDNNKPPVEIAPVQIDPAPGVQAQGEVVLRHYLEGHERGEVFVATANDGVPLARMPIRQRQYSFEGYGDEEDHIPDGGHQPIQRNAKRPAIRIHVPDHMNNAITPTGGAAGADGFQQREFHLAPNPQAQQYPQGPMSGRAQYFGSGTDGTYDDWHESGFYPFLVELLATRPTLRNILTPNARGGKQTFDIFHGTDSRSKEESDNEGLDDEEKKRRRLGPKPRGNPERNIDTTPATVGGPQEGSPRMGTITVSTPRGGVPATTPTGGAASAAAKPTTPKAATPRARERGPTSPRPAPVVADNRPVPANNGPVSPRGVVLVASNPAAENLRTESSSSDSDSSSDSSSYGPMPPNDH